MSSTIYIQFKDKLMIKDNVSKIILDDIARSIAPQKCIVGDINVHTLTKKDGNIFVISAIQVIEQIKIKYPQCDVQIIGAQEIIVAKQNQQSKHKSLLMVALAWIVLFFGAGLTIMYFHEDVSMKEVHQNLHYYLTDEQKESPYWLHVPYSIGIGLGMAVFFNHIFSKKLNEDPSPLEVEMFLYQDNVDQYMTKKPETKPEKKHNKGES